jgi:hypothetical protein
MADNKKRTPQEDTQKQMLHQTPAPQQDDTQGNLASSQRGLADVQRAAELPDPSMLAALARQNPVNQGMQQPGVAAPNAPQDTSGLGPAGDTYHRPGSRITKEMLQKATRTMHRYRAGKASVEKRIIDAQQWWKLHNWEQIESQHGVTGSRSDKSNTAWLWNCIVGKHADAMDSYPEPVILPRMEDDEGEARKLSEIVPVVLKVNDFERTYSDVAWQKMLEGTGAYGVYWDQSKLNGLGDISVRKVNILNLFWEPGVTNIQDSKNVFHVALVDNDILRQQYPQLEGEPLSSPSTVSRYRYDDAVSTTDKSLVVDWYYHLYKNGRKILHHVKYVGEHVLSASEDKDPDRGIYDDGMFPFVLDPLFPVEGSPCGFGYIHVGKETQKDIDLISQAVVSNAVVNATPRWFLRDDGGIREEDAADTTKPFIRYKGTLSADNLIPVVNPQLPGNVADVLAMKIDELKFVTGNADVNNGGTPSGVTAASAIAALKEDAGRSSKDSNKAAYRAYSQIVTMVIERIRQFYDAPRQFRIVGPRGEVSFEPGYTNAGIMPQPLGDEFGVQMGYRVPAFDIDVRAQRETSYTKAAQNELAIQFLQLGVFNPQMADQTVLMLDMMDFKGKEELQQKVQQMGTMALALQQIASVASQMAMQIGDQQAAAMIQQIAMQVGGMPTLPAGGALQGLNMPQGDAVDGGFEAKKHPFVEKAEKQSEEATRPA